MKTENVFSMAKSYQNIALQNFKLLQTQNEKMLTLFIKEMENGNKKLGVNYNEWLTDTKKALDDYQALVLRGLDYLSDCFEKSNQRPSQNAPE